ASTWSAKKLAILGRQLGKFLTSLHTFPIDQAEAIDIPMHPPFEKWQERYHSIEKHTFPVVSQEIAGEITRSFEQFFNSLASIEPALKVIHFDLKPDHIIVNPNTEELAGVIDFGDIEIGDPAYDFTFFARYQQNLTPFVLEEYKVTTDPAFLDRVAFYQKILPVMDLDHALEIGAVDRAE